MDSSALIKRFIAEKGSQFVDHIVSRHRPVTVSQISYIEIHSCFARLKRQRVLSEKAYAALSKQFEKEFLSCRRIELTLELFAIARSILEKHSLRSLDAIQLASAARLKQATGDLLIFAGADRRLLDVAEAEGFRIIDVEEEPSRGWKI